MISQDLIVSIRRRSLGLTIADVSPCIIAIATIAESMIGRICFGIPLELLERPPALHAHVRDHFDEVKNFHLFVLHSFDNEE